LSFIYTPDWEWHELTVPVAVFWQSVAAYGSILRITPILRSTEGADMSTSRTDISSPNVQALVSYLEHEKQPTIILDTDYNIIAANPAYQRQFGVKGKPHVGAKCYRVSHQFSVPCDQAGEHCPMRKAHASQHRRRGQLSARHLLLDQRLSDSLAVVARAPRRLAAIDQHPVAATGRSGGTLARKQCPSWAGGPGTTGAGGQRLSRLTQ
jgi:PAS domain-containing protein